MKRITNSHYTLYTIKELSSLITERIFLLRNNDVLAEAIPLRDLMILTHLPKLIRICMVFQDVLHAARIGCISRFSLHAPRLTHVAEAPGP